ncbi:hypothetical protein [Roseicitreum antarcticum]|uniref:hypothetical protein n=1 Tax=Roseicitreum antarcticum TaxID=564137 RepID=UPI0016810748|nr:hypothetical protein [Roseicitreum antarcticum]
MSISALSGARDGAGYSESLKRLLDGGINLVRLTSPAVNWHLDAVAAKMPGGLVSHPSGFRAGDLTAIWRDNVAVAGGLVVGPMLIGVPADHRGFPAIALEGLTPRALVCRAHDVVRSTRSIWRQRPRALCAPSMPKRTARGSACTLPCQRV